MAEVYTRQEMFRDVFMDFLGELPVDGEIYEIESYIDSAIVAAQAVVDRAGHLVGAQ